jgi:hypothetical protein
LARRSAFELAWFGLAVQLSLSDRPAVGHAALNAAAGAHYFLVKQTLNLLHYFLVARLLAGWCSCAQSVLFAIVLQLAMLNAV